MDRPSLQEIADMPMSEARKAIRSNYDRDWKLFSDADGELHTFRVTIGYTRIVDDEEVFVVEAPDKEAAEELAEDRFHETADETAEIVDIETEQDDA